MVWTGNPQHTHYQLVAYMDVTPWFFWVICVFFCVGQREAVLPHTDQLPGSQQPDGGGLHVVHTVQPHPEREGWREGKTLQESTELIFKSQGKVNILTSTSASSVYCIYLTSYSLSSSENVMRWFISFTHLNNCLFTHLLGLFPSALWRKEHTSDLPACVQHHCERRRYSDKKILRGSPGGLVEKLQNSRLPHKVQTYRHFSVHLSVAPGLHVFSFLCQVSALLSMLVSGFRTVAVKRPRFCSQGETRGTRQHPLNVKQHACSTLFWCSKIFNESFVVTGKSVKHVVYFAGVGAAPGHVQCLRSALAPVWRGFQTGCSQTQSPGPKAGARSG